MNEGELKTIREQIRRLQEDLANKASELSRYMEENGMLKGDNAAKVKALAESASTEARLRAQIEQLQLDLVEARGSVKGDADCSAKIEGVLNIINNELDTQTISNAAPAESTTDITKVATEALLKLKSIVSP